MMLCSFHCTTDESLCLFLKKSDTHLSSIIYLEEKSFFRHERAISKSMLDILIAASDESFEVLLPIIYLIQKLPFAIA